jgi:NAD(P)-dependent dehydrogenase (short-subunit alcohol dehydrogenase family)
MATNTRGAFFVAQEVGKRMIERGKGGSIINISSIAGIRPMEMLAIYWMSKAALSHMTRVLAVEWAKYNIRVNAIAPGYIETPANLEFFETEYGEAFLQRFLRRRVGIPQHLDGTLMLLAGSGGDFITGQTIVVDDGYT